MNAIAKCYLLKTKISKKTAWACAPNDRQPSHELNKILDTQDSFPFSHHLKRIGLRRGELIESDNLTRLRLWDDMLPESYALPLMSKRLRLIIENNLTGKEKIEWITANVIGGNVTQKYYVAKFRCKLDVLDHKETVFGENAAHIVIPCFSSKKIMAYAVFHKPGWFWKIPTALYVCERLKKIITKERLTGVAFEEAYVK